MGAANQFARIDHTKNKSRWEMKTKTLLSAGILATAVLCSGANATQRGITVNEWTAISGESGATTAAVSVTPTDLSLLPVNSVPGISIVVTPGVPSGPVFIGSTSFGLPGQQAVEYAWGGSGNGSDGTFAQVLLTPSSPTSFGLALGYGPGFTPSAASVDIDNTIYVPANGVSPGDTSSSFVFNLVKGAWDVVAANWTAESDTTGGGATAAPEIDPASAVSALTLLAGMLALIIGKSPRLRRARRPF
jgi:hypothetical protein